MKDFHCTVLTEKRVKIIYIQVKQFLEVTVKQIIGGTFTWKEKFLEILKPE